MDRNGSKGRNGEEEDIGEGGRNGEEGRENDGRERGGRDRGLVVWEILRCLDKDEMERGGWNGRWRKRP